MSGFIAGNVAHGDDGEGVGPVGDRDDASRAAHREGELNDLAGKAANGDKRALERLLELIRTPVVRYCRARMGDGIGLLTAEDVAQDVLLAICGGLARFRPGETAAMAFVYGIARNKVVDAFRASGRDQSEPTDAVPDAVDDRLGPEAVAVFGTEVGELRDLLSLLPPAHREILVLRVAMQYSAEETALVVGSTPGAVRVTQHRALSKLRALIAERVTSGLDWSELTTGTPVLATGIAVRPDTVPADTTMERLQAGYDAYASRVAAKFDLDAGLDELLLQDRHRDVVADITRHVDLEASLEALIRDAGGE